MTVNKALAATSRAGFFVVSMSEWRPTGRPCIEQPLEEVDMLYVDGFVLAVPKDKLDSYKELATLAGKVWKEHGAIDYVECIADDVPYGELTSFPRAVQAKEDEIVVFSWITYESREKRDEVNAKVMSDPRLKPTMDSPPFDGKRMIYGGFKTLLRM
jgi:uncharacterized protein YbaA (DUF1428 family)